MEKVHIQAWKMEKANVIGLFVEALKGTEDLEKLLHSQFGKLFHLSVARCCNSVKLVYALLSRQLVTMKKHKIWFIFGGQPLRYLIQEFKEITRLNCNPEPDSTEEEDDDPDLPRWKRLPLALIILVDGVLFCNCKNLALTEKYVEMLTDLDSFMLYPWDRVSFNKTKTSACYGFPLSLQLMALQSIPMLVSKIPQPDNLKTFIEDPEGCQNVITLLHLEDILVVESDPLLSVEQTVVDGGDNDHHNELRWGDEVEDAEVAFMQELMAEGYKFSPSDFAVAPAPIVDLSDAEDEGNNEQEPEPSTRPKKKLKTHQTEKRK
ncbi:hypothetical protein EUTSA_v10000483mg, partial [Eutrema salsugineum]